MKKLLLAVFILINLNVFCQKTCEYDQNIKDSLGTYKATKEYLIQEQNFGSKSDYIYFHLSNTDEVPTLNIEIINKNNAFIKAKCFDNKSRIFIQLTDRKIIPLVYLGNDTCGTMVLDQKNNSVRVLSGIFGFPKDAIDDLKKRSFNFMRIKFATENEDYIIQKTLHSELDSLYYEPENYFINYLKCVE